MFTLIVYRDGIEEFRYPWRAPLINLGRSPQCDVMLSDETVSTLHANLLSKGADRLVIDLDSTNGTYLNGEKVTRSPLKAGDVRGVGRYQIRFEPIPMAENTAVTRVLSAEAARPAPPIPDSERRIIEENAASREREKMTGRLRALEEENRRLLRESGGGLAHGFIGSSPAMLRLFEQAARVAVSDVPLLITGETGTGKSALARHIHSLSNRKRGEFIVIDCAAIPSELLESELFGHEKGAFTGAVTQKKGRIELAHGGTLFLDEIGDMPLGLQAKLLRFLQEKHFERLGGNATVAVDARVIAATHRDLRKAIPEKTFREDLYYRLCGVELHIPPLRERGPDIVRMAQTFLEEACLENNLRTRTLTREALDLLTSHPWEGNVRELRHTIQAAALLAPGDAITPHDLKLTAGSALPDPDLTLTLDEAHAAVDQRLVRFQLEANRGHYSKTAKALGIDRGRLSRLMEKYGIEGKRKAGEEDDA